ncbi:hypothetical protein [Haloarchaeobius amylolyticus]|uniref:hypothetical protein n=1 Tax=Haloarchaeobius amylolyticus TaxID=1198296 RepID=UPI0022713BE9|nr:hypothetical protein [Haloarchaeobius amylolyticus]
MVGEEPIESEEQFEKQLRNIVNEATKNGVPVEGGWSIRNEDPSLPTLDVEIVVLAERLE